MLGSETGFVPPSRPRGILNASEIAIAISVRTVEISVSSRS